MSKGAIFQLIVKDDRFDKVFTASEYLARNLKQKGLNATFADIESSHRLFVRSTYKPYAAITSEYTKVLSSCGSLLGSGSSALQFTIPSVGQFISDIVLHLRFGALGKKNAAPTDPYFQWCALPGVRALQYVSFTSDQMIIDDYTPDDVLAWAKFFINKDHLMGWMTCHGQQTMNEATFFGNNITVSATYQDGPQTPKQFQPAFDCFIPLNFWFCHNTESALMTDLFPSGQRYINCDVAPISLLAKAVTLNTDLTFSPATGDFSNITMNAELYVNGLYVNTDVHEVFSRHVGFSLIRVHRRQKFVAQQSASVLLDQLKFPAEYLLVTARAKALADNFNQWWLSGISIPRPQPSALIFPYAVWNANPLINRAELAIATATDISSLSNLISHLGVTAYGIDLYPLTPSTFYNAYKPIRYHFGAKTVPPIDNSVFLISFCLLPGSDQPSGYYNLSSGRELYLKYQMSENFIAESEILVTMSALNFLVRSGDTIKLKFMI